MHVDCARYVSLASALVQACDGPAEASHRVANDMASRLQRRLAAAPGTHVAQVQVVAAPAGLTLNGLIGRRAHIAFLEDAAVVHRLVAGLAPYFEPEDEEEA